MTDSVKVVEWKMHNLIATGILLLALSNTLSALDCFLSDNIECSCSDESLNCFGVQKEVTEVQQLLLNVTATYSTIDFLYLDWNIKNLTLESNFTFEGLKLQNVTLGRDLTSLPGNLFLGLGSSLINLNLQHNNIEMIYNQSLSSLYNLKELFLDFNSFNKISGEMFFNLSNLELLSLSGNNLNILENDFLVELPMLHTLILDGNNFSFISDVKISSLSLTTLLARNCSINGSLIKDSLKDVKNLEYLDLSSNQLEEIESYVFSDLYQLKELNLSYNFLTSMNNFAFSALHSLRSLDLKKNKLLRIATTSFKNLTNLKHLDLSENRLEVFYENYTSDLFALESINLGNNKIKFITAGTFSTSLNLQEILLKGNIFDCTCEISYFASYLFNNSHIRLGDSNDAICDSPPDMKGTELTKIDMVAMNCVDLPDPEDDYENTEDDYDDLDTTELDKSTTERTNMSTTTGIVSTLLPIAHNKTTEIVPSGSPVADSTTTEVISTTTHSSTSTSPFVSSTIAEKIDVPSENSTLTSSFSADGISVTSDLPTDISTTQSKPSNEIIQILKNFTLGRDFCINWRITDKSRASKCVIVTSDSGGNKQKSISCPTSDTGKDRCVTFEKTYKFCVKVILHEGTEQQHCPITPDSTTSTTESVKITTKSLLPTVTDSREETSVTPSTLTPLLIPQTSSSSVIPSSLSTTVILSTSTVSSTLTPPDSVDHQYTSVVEHYQPTDTTKAPTELTTQFKMPPTKSNVIHFKVLSFTTAFVNSNSTMILKWAVNKNESRSICHLAISLNSNLTKDKFPCANNSLRMENFKYENYNICLMIYHDHYKTTQDICRSSLGYSNKYEASKYKDQGYTNSPLIVVICLLIVILILIIILAMKKMMKKRGESDRYNVSAEEKRVQIRTSLKRPESCVRYSYIVKEDKELVV